MDLERLNRLKRKADFYRDDAPEWCRAIWPRPQSLSNFIKQHREPLKQAGALRRIGRDFFVDAEVFPRAAASILGLDGEGEQS